jgi:hypothetical protein
MLVVSLFVDLPRTRIQGFFLFSLLFIYFLKKFPFIYLLISILANKVHMLCLILSYYMWFEFLNAAFMHVLSINKGLRLRLVCRMTMNSLY